jgi:hypothetical protein
MSYDAATPERFRFPRDLAAIKKALKKAGVEFTNGKKPGVRLEWVVLANNEIAPVHPYAALFSSK